jgi:hypothetical protein
MQRVYLYVPYHEKDMAKGMGAKWDAEKKRWYCEGKGKKFKRWMNKPVTKKWTPVGVAQSRIQQFSYK